MRAALCVLMVAALPWAHAQQGRGGALIEKLEQVVFQRGGCYGRCPAYSVTIAADGRVEYLGMGDVKVLGMQSERLSAAEMRQLKDELNQAGYFGLRDRYDSPEAGCTSIATDSPSVKISVRADGRVKAVDHYLGCRGAALDRLVRLERAIDRIAGTSRWIGAPDERQERITAGNSSQAAFPPDFERGKTDQELISIYRRSARSGNCHAALRLGEIYDKGFRSIARDYGEALTWYNNAQSLGCRMPQAVTR